MRQRRSSVLVGVAAAAGVGAAGPVGAAGAAAAGWAVDTVGVSVGARASAGEPVAAEAAGAAGVAEPSANGSRSAHPVRTAITVSRLRFRMKHLGVSLLQPTAKLWAICESAGILLLSKPCRGVLPWFRHGNTWPGCCYGGEGTRSTRESSNLSWAFLRRTRRFMARLFTVQH